MINCRAAAARIALARVPPARGSTWDDVLSRWTPRWGHLVRECITGLLKERGRLVVLVTHQTHWLDMCDHVVQMDDGGRVCTQGPPSGMPRGSNPSLTDLERAHVAGGSGGGVRARRRARQRRRQQEEDADGGGGQRRRRDKPAAAAATSGGGAGADGGSADEGGGSRAAWCAARCGRPRARLGFTSARGSSRCTRSAGAHARSSYWLTLWSADKFGQYSFGTSGFYIAVYAALSLSAAFLIWLRVVVVATATIRAGRRLHRAAISAVMGSPTSFFDVTPLGRILNRFSADLQVVDIQLRMTTQQFFLCASSSSASSSS